MVMKQMPPRPEQMHCIHHSSHNNTDKRNRAGDVIHLRVGPDHCQEELSEFEEVHERVVPAVDDSCVVTLDIVRVRLDVFLHDLGDDEVE